MAPKPSAPVGSPKPKHPGGRPKGSGVKLTPEVQARCESGSRVGAPILDVCDYAGIAPETFYDWLHKGERGEGELYESFSESIKKARATRRIKALARIEKHGEKWWQADAWFLERSDPANWGRRDRVVNEHSGPGGGPIIVAPGKIAALDFNGEAPDKAE